GDPEAAPRAARLLDAYASRWQAAYLDACEAMRAGAQAPQLGALRLSCLEARRQEAAAVVDLFRHATAATVQQSSDAVLGLPGVSGCGEVDALSTPVPPPDDGPVRQQIDRLSRDLARVVAESAAGDPRALGHAEALVAEANQVGFAPLQAEALLSLGSAYLYGGRPDLARDLYLRSLTSAERGRVDAVRARACARLAWSVGHYFGHYEEADRWMEAALAILDRTPAIDAEVNARHILASLRTAEGRIQESLAALDRMDELIRKRGRPDDPDRVRALSARSDDLAELGRFQEAAGYAREALARQIELRGTRHPITARLEYLLARVLVEAGGTVEARELLDRTASYWIDAGTPSAPELLDAGDIRATSFQREGRFQQALDEALRIRAIRERAQGPDHADLSFTLGNVGFALLGLGRPAEAITPLERALALQTRAGLKLSPTAEGKLALAQALWRTGGDRARARALARDAEQASRIAPEGRIHREAAAWLAEHPDPAPRVDGQ
ncbi:MAG TPA: tetratricopeptide repeat protein, partial [Myxococcales bacterium]|nr:tetratricopeptide repeat protein [Myxococcales bacterium]